MLWKLAYGAIMIYSSPSLISTLVDIFFDTDTEEIADDC